MQYVANVLSRQPYTEVVGLINKLQVQVAAQETKKEEKTDV